MIEQLERPGATIAILFVGLLVFSGAAILCAALLPANEKVFALVAGLAGGFDGALLTYIQRRVPTQDTVHTSATEKQGEIK